MAFVHGKSAYFRLDNAAGSLVDLSAYCDNIDFPESVDNPETTTFGEATRRRTVVGLKDLTISLSGPWDATLDAHMTGILGHATSKTYEYGPAGSTGGFIKKTGECRLSEYSVNSPVDGPVTWSATLEADDDVTNTTF